MMMMLGEGTDNAPNLIRALNVRSANAPGWPSDKHHPSRGQGIYNPRRRPGSALAALSRNEVFGRFSTRASS